MEKNSMKMRLTTYFLALLAVILTSCGEKGQDTQSASAPKKAVLTNMTSKQAASFESISAKIASLPKYDFYRVKDPFFSPVVQQSVKQVKSGVAAKNLKPTQKFEIEKYKLLGVVTEKKTKAAIFEDPDGKGWVLKEGMQIGNEGFKIKKISPEGVTVEEVVVDESGRKKSSEMFISIKKMP